MDGDGRNLDHPLYAGMVTETNSTAIEQQPSENLGSTNASANSPRNNILSPLFVNRIQSVEQHVFPNYNSSSAKMMFEMPTKGYKEGTYASRIHTHLDGPLITSGIAVVCEPGICFHTTLLFICFKDEYGKPCHNYSGLSVEVEPSDSVLRLTCLKLYGTTDTKTIAFNVSSEQGYKLSVKLGTEHVKGSPFEFYGFNVSRRQENRFNDLNFPKSAPVVVPNIVSGISDTEFGTILVTCRETRNIFEYDTDLNLIRTSISDFKSPSKAIFLKSPRYGPTIVVADGDDVVMMDYFTFEVRALCKNFGQSLDLCVAGDLDTVDVYILVTNSDSISVLNSDLTKLGNIQNLEINSPKAICRGYLNHIIVADYITSSLIVFKIKFKGQLIIGEPLRRLFPNPRLHKKPKLQGVSLDMKSGCVLVCDTERRSVTVFSYLLEAFTNLRNVDVPTLGVVSSTSGVLDRIYVTTVGYQIMMLNRLFDVMAPFLEHMYNI